MGDVHFADSECSACGWRHQIDAFEPGDRVVVVYDIESAALRRLIEAGTPAEVTEWRAWPGNSVWVRVEFPDGTRENYDPCQLEHA